MALKLSMPEADKNIEPVGGTRREVISRPTRISIGAFRTVDTNKFGYVWNIL